MGHGRGFSRWVFWPIFDGAHRIYVDQPMGMATRAGHAVYWHFDHPAAQPRAARTQLCSGPSTCAQPKHSSSLARGF